MLATFFFQKLKKFTFRIKRHTGVVDLADSAAVVEMVVTKDEAVDIAGSAARAIGRSGVVGGPARTQVARGTARHRQVQGDTNLHTD